MEGVDMPKLTPVAVDVNVLINFANRDEVVIDCLGTIKKRLPNPRIIVLPTVILELTHISEWDDDPKVKALAKLALESIVDPWGFLPVNCVPVGHGIVEQIGRKIREKRLLPEQEIHDSFVIAEAALYGAAILISSDSHIKDVDRHMLKIELSASDVDCPLIASPWKIVHQFFRG
jgi:predicted nucleic acid-binding protein